MLYVLVISTVVASLETRDRHSWLVFRSAIAYAIQNPFIQIGILTWTNIVSGVIWLWSFLMNNMCGRHIFVIELVNMIPCMVCICCYWNYAPVQNLKKKNKYTQLWNIVCHIARNKQLNVWACRYRKRGRNKIASTVC